MNEDMKFDSEAPGPMTRNELMQLGDGEVAYIKQLNLDVAQKLFPALRGKLEGIDLYAVLGADGTPFGAYRQPQCGHRQRHRERSRSLERALTLLQAYFE